MQNYIYPISHYKKRCKGISGAFTSLQLCVPMNKTHVWYYLFDSLFIYYSIFPEGEFLTQLHSRVWTIYEPWCFIHFLLEQKSSMLKHKRRILKNELCHIGLTFLWLWASAENLPSHLSSLSISFCRQASVMLDESESLKSHGKCAGTKRMEWYARKKAW